MEATFEAERIVLATWPACGDAVERAVHPAVEPVEIDGSFRVSLVALRYRGGRFGRVPIPPFSQLNLRTYVTFGGERAVYFLRAYVTPPGMAAAVVGAPYRPVRLRVEDDRADAPGIGVALRYAAAKAEEPGELGKHELGLFEAAGLRAFRVRRGRAEWRRATLTEPARADALLAHGFRTGAEPTLYTATRASFTAAVPRRVA